MAKGITDEVKTGLFVIICIAALLFLTFSVGKFRVFNQQYKVKVLFNIVAGIEKDAPVRLSGVEVGRLKDIELLYEGDETKVLLTLILNSNAKLREDSKARITTLGLMGEKYIELTAGSKGTAFLNPDSIIIGEDPVSVEEMIDIGKKVVAEVENTLVEIKTLSNHLDGVVVENKADINETISSLKRTTKNFEEFSADIKNNPWKLLIKTKEK